MCLWTETMQNKIYYKNCAGSKFLDLDDNDSLDLQWMTFSQTVDFFKPTFI